MPTNVGNPHDRFFREVWSRKEVGRDFLRYHLAQDIVALLDLKSLELVKDTFVDEQLREHLPSIIGLLRELGEKRTALGYLEALLRYLALAAETVTEDDLRRVIGSHRYGPASAGEDTDGDVGTKVVRTRPASRSARRFTRRHTGRGGTDVDPAVRTPFRYDPADLPGSDCGSGC